MINKWGMGTNSFMITIHLDKQLREEGNQEYIVMMNMRMLIKHILIKEQNHFKISKTGNSTQRKEKSSGKM